jgi:hypothetical protein
MINIELFSVGIEILVMLMISSNQQIWNSIMVLIQTLKLDEQK